MPTYFIPSRKQMYRRTNEPFWEELTMPRALLYYGGLQVLFCTENWSSPLSQTYCSGGVGTSLLIDVHETAECEEFSVWM